MTTTSERIRIFHELHQRGCFVMPNPWDRGSARLLMQLGYSALATTSSGYAWSTGRSDNDTPLEDALAHFRQIAEAVEVPVNADFQDGFAPDPVGVARNVRRACATGVAGLSIEDFTRDRRNPLFEFSVAVERVRAAREAIDQGETPLVLTARSEGFVVGLPDLDDTVRRLSAFAEAGADCLYAPGLRTAEQIKAVVEAVAPKAVNVLVGSDVKTVVELAELGARRISIGGALARAAWTTFLQAAGETAENGTFSWLGNAIPFPALDGRFSDSPEGGAASRR